MHYRIEEYSNYQEQEVLRLYESVGWINYTHNPMMLKNAYAHSLKIYAAYVNDQLAGIIRSVGDGFSVVFVQDLLVDPQYQRQGIGTSLLDRMIKEYATVYQMHLMTENTERTISFYRSLGFTQAADLDCCAFSRYFSG